MLAKTGTYVMSHLLCCHRKIPKVTTLVQISNLWGSLLSGGRYKRYIKLVRLSSFTKKMEIRKNSSEILRSTNFYVLIDVDATWVGSSCLDRVVSGRPES